MPEMTTAQFARWLRRFPTRLHAEVAKGESRALRKAKSAALAVSSGTLSVKRLRRLGHPYAKGFAGGPPRDPALINRQTGTFRSSWEMQFPSTGRADTEIVSKLLNTAPYAVYVQGGGRSAMIARPFVAKIVDDTHAARLEEAQKALRRALIRHA